MILIITYDLRTPKDYHDFYEAIKAQADNGKWWHYMASTWLISTSKTPQQVVDAIRDDRYLDRQDFLFVCELKPNYQGWLPKAAWDWLGSEFPQYGRDYSALLGVLSGIADSQKQTSPTAPPLPGYPKITPPPGLLEGFTKSGKK